MLRLLMSFIGISIIAVGGLYFIRSNMPQPHLAQNLLAVSTRTAQNSNSASQTPVTNQQVVSDTTADVSTQSTTTTTLESGQVAYTNDQLLALADNKYASGNVPLGDYKYVTDAPKKGYIYLCNVHKDNPGSMVNGPWMSTNSWNFLQKVSISGSVSWPEAFFTNKLSAAYRTLTGNDLPVGYTTGVFPVASNDPAHAYDANPNTISAQTVADVLPANPTYSDTPYCMGGEVGVMLDGVALFNGFDAGLRDAAAHELQDKCDGHPQGSGEYHYHSLSSCFKDVGVGTVLGFAYDGFPITGPLVAPGKYLTTDNLDECHGLTSEIILDGRKVISYHYVMTQDFPYSVSCFRGKSTTTGPSAGAPQSQSASQSQATSGQAGQGNPPQAAIEACTGKSVDAACAVSTPRGTIAGTCRTPPNSSLACVPN